MTRRKKTKSNASQNAPAGVTAAPIAVKAVAAGISGDNSITNPIKLHPVPNNNTTHLSATSHPVAKASTASSSVASSVVNEVGSTRSSEQNDKESKTTQKKKKPVNIKVTYVTEQIHIYPKYPVLTVERLKDLDSHINMLTEGIGRRPRVYQHGKGVRFVPETSEEYRIMQRYLAKIESAERIAWCSYTVPTGNSLRVNVKVRKVEVLKVTENLQKLNLENGTNATTAKAKDSSSKDVKISNKDSSLENAKVKKNLPAKEVQISTKDSLPRGGNLKLKDFLPGEGKLRAKDQSPISSNCELTGSKTVEIAPKDSQSPTTNIKPENKKKKVIKLYDIKQNRSYKRKTMY